MEKEEAIKSQSCWKFWFCPKILRENCPVFKAKAGRDCWRLMDDFVRNPALKIKCRYADCLECPWFKKSHSFSETLSAKH